MAKTIANVLVGEATLGIRQPNDAIAEWDAVNYHEGTHSVKLTKTGTGSAGPTYLEVKPTGVTFASFNTNMAIADKYTFYHLHQAGITGNYTMVGFRFNDPDSDNGHVEITAVPFQNHPGNGIFTKYDFNTAAPKVGYYGENEVGTRMDDWSLATATTQTVKAIIGNLCVVAADTSADNWVLAWVRYVLWESNPARYACIDNIVINGSTYTVEPGGTAPAISLGSPFTEVGYTEDGVTIEYAAEQTDIMVHEETFAIGSPITKESITITCNMAEASLANMNNAMAGAVLSGSKITLGDGVNKTMNLKIEGTNPAGFLRAIYIPKAVASGTVGMSYKKGEKTIIPVSFKALKAQDSEVCMIVDNIA